MAAKKQRTVLQAPASLAAFIQVENIIDFVVKDLAPDAYEEFLDSLEEYTANCKAAWKERNGRR